MQRSSRHSFSVLLALALLWPAPRRLSAADTWAVVVPGNVDSRIAGQIKQLAAQNRAELHMPVKEEDAGALHPKLWIELALEPNVSVFLQTLKRNIAEKEPSPPEPTSELAQEGYVLVVAHALGATRIHITAVDARGFHNALLRVPELLRGTASLSPYPKGESSSPVESSASASAAFDAVTSADYPSFPERGIVEGFYGAPWSHEERLDMLRFEGQHGMNVYYYAPKDDPYHRKLWRQPYPSAQRNRLGELVTTARENFVDFCFAISPGLSMVYSSPRDFATLARKLDSVSKLGVSCFALFLDDVPQDLQNPKDRARFETLAAAHAYVINRLDRTLKSKSSKNRLTVTPTTYTNEWGSRDYIRALGAAVSPDVELVWTGQRVVSPAITVAQAQEWSRLLRRPPLIWDNFPVNDGISWRLNLGPLAGRDPDLPIAVRGLVSNPMNQARASFIPLGTIADYLWNAGRYDPARAHRQAITAQYGENAPELLAPLLKIYGDYWWDENLFKPLSVEERKAIDAPGIERAIAQIESSLELLGKHERFQKLAAEISPFPSRMRDRLALLRADPAFRELPDRKLQWREDYDVLSATRLAMPPALDGSFGKWLANPAKPVYDLNSAAQIAQGTKLWKGPGTFSARMAFGWDERFFYVGVDVTDRKMVTAFRGRDIVKGDAMILNLETAFRKNFESTHANGDEYRLFFSPGNFARVRPSIYSEEDYLPPRPHSRATQREIKTAWKKTRRGFSGDIAIPVSYFSGFNGPNGLNSSTGTSTGAFRAGYEIGLSFAVQKALPTRRAKRGEPPAHMVFTSKSDHLFPVRFGNPSTYQRLVFTGDR